MRRFHAPTPPWASRGAWVTPRTGAYTPTRRPIPEGRPGSRPATSPFTVMVAAVVESAIAVPAVIMPTAGVEMKVAAAMRPAAIFLLEAICFLFFPYRSSHGPPRSVFTFPLCGQNGPSFVSHSDRRLVRGHPSMFDGLRDACPHRTPGGHGACGTFDGTPRRKDSRGS